MVTTMLSKNVRSATRLRHSFVRKLQHDVPVSRVHNMCRRYKTASATATASIEEKNPQEVVTTTLKEVPMLPYLGSLLPFYSNIPQFDPEKFLEFYPEMRRRYGDFYKLGLPGIGKGRYGETYVVTDPNEMMKVIRQEKTSHLPYPRGILQTEWPILNLLKGTDSSLANGKDDVDGEMSFDQDGFMGRGETWKRLRLFLQTDLLSPKAAKGYIPGMVLAAQIASKVAPASASNLNAYANRCAFDMFNSLMFGELTKTADLSTADKTNIEFCDEVVHGISQMIYQMIQPNEIILGRELGIQTSAYKSMSASLAKVFGTAEDKYNAFRTKYENEPDSLTELQRNSYLARAIERQKDGAESPSSSSISKDDLIEVVKIMLTAAVDTTSSPMSWNLYHIAVNHDVQEKLFDELSTAVEETEEGCINEHVLKRSTCPYLHAVIRETHRLSPPFATGLQKENSLSDAEIHGTVIPKDSMVMFDSYSVGIDPEYVKDPMEFRPERWLDDAVEARKGTPSEILDHPFYKDPFSQGSRKCPGSRVANNEVAILLSQLVLDWKITAPSHIKGFTDMESKLTGMITPKLPTLNFTSRS